jgi:hypothetical protein
MISSQRGLSMRYRIAFVVWLLAAATPAAAQTCLVGNPRVAPNSRYTVSEPVAGQRVVQDLRTGLVWKQCMQGRSGATCAGVESALNWSQALSAGANEIFAGQSDWRLPSINELRSLVESGCYGPAINTTAFPGSSSGLTWSSTTLTASGASAWVVLFFDGSSGASGKSSGQRVRLVRGGLRLDPFDSGRDFTPNGYSFTAQTGVPIADLRTSNTINVNGINTQVSIGVSGATESAYSINGGPFVSAPGAVNNGDSVTVRHRSAATLNTMATTTVNIGGVIALFQTTTAGLSPSTTQIISVTPATSQTIGTPYTVSVSVTGAAPTGTVTVDDGDSNTCTITLPASNCSLTSTAVGTKTISATYAGDPNNAGSDDTESYEITAVPPNSPGGVQVGAATLGATIAGLNALTTITFPQAFSAIPVVIVQPSDEGGDPLAVRIRNVTTTGFQLLQVEAPGCPGCDGSGDAMTVHWLAAMPGSYRLTQDTAVAPAWAAQTLRGSGAGALLKVGAITTTATQYDLGSGHFGSWPAPSWDAVNWPALGGELDFLAAPVLLTTVQSWNNEGSNLGPSGLTGASQPWATSVARNLSTAGFDVAIEASGVAEDDTAPDGFAAPGETIGYVAIQSAVSQLLVPLSGPPSVGLVTLGTTLDGANCTSVNGLFPLGTTIDNGTNFRAFGGKQTRALDAGGWLRRCALSNPNQPSNEVSVGMRLDVDEYVPPIAFRGANDEIGVVALSGDLSTTPVTLAKMSVTRQGAGLQVNWTTASETGQLGFRLWGRAGSGDWRLLQAPIIGSAEPNARSASRYQHTIAEAGDVTEVRLEDVDVLGNSRFHPAIAVGSSRGEEPLPSPIDWAGIRAANLAQTVRNPARGSSPQALIKVRVDGVQRVTANALIALDSRFAGIAAHELALSDNGAPVPRHVSCAVLQPGCFVEFLGLARESRYGPENAYLLSLSAASARAVGSGNTRAGNGTRRVFPETLRFEPNIGYSESTPAPDPWYDAFLNATSGPQELSRSFTLPDRSSGEVTLTAQIWGAFDFPGPDPDHHVQLYLNNTLIADRHFDGFAIENIEMAVPSALLTASNTLRLRVPRDTGFSMDAVIFDGYRVRYPRESRVIAGELFEGEIDPRISTAGDALHANGFENDSFSGFQLDGHGAGAVLWSVRESELRRDELSAGSVLVNAATSAWRVADPERIATPSLALPADGYVLPEQLDYLVVTHPQFESGLAPLLALQASRGLNTAVLRTDEIYAAHSDHARDPLAIKTAITAAQQRGARFVLLVGGDSWDYHNYLGLDSQGFLPTWYRPVNRYMFHAATDHPYADLNDDGLGQLAIGRLPVRTLAEMDRIVSSIVARGNTIASRYLGVAGLSQPHERFGAHSRATLSYLRQPGQQLEFALADELGTATARTRAQAGLAGTADWLSYLGHSSWNRWAFDNLLDVSQLGVITRSGLPAIVSQWSCQTNDFAIPINDTMAHALMLRANGLASAVLGATTVVEDASHLALATRFFDLVEDGRLGDAGGLPIRTIGEALNAAKSDLVTREPAHASAALSIVLFGDPAAPLLP